MAGAEKFAVSYLASGPVNEADDCMDDLFLETLGEILNYVDEMGCEVPKAAFSGESFHRKRKNAEVTCIGMRYRHLWAG